MHQSVSDGRTSATHFGSLLQPDLVLHKRFKQVPIVEQNLQGLVVVFGHRTSSELHSNAVSFSFVRRGPHNKETRFLPYKTAPLS